MAKRGPGDLGSAVIRTLRAALREDSEQSEGGRAGFRALHELIPSVIAEYRGWGESNVTPDRRNVLRSLRRLVDRDEVIALEFDPHVAQAWRKGQGQHGDRGTRPVPVYRLNDGAL